MAGHLWDRLGMDLFSHGKSPSTFVQMTKNRSGLMGFPEPMNFSNKPGIGFVRVCVA